MTAGRRAAAIVVGTCIATAVACGVPTEDQPRVRPESDVPFGLLGTVTTAPPSTATGPSTGVCFVRDARVHVVAVPVPPGAGAGERLDVAATARPPTFATALEDDTVTGLRLSAGTATISLGSSFRDRTARDQQLAVAQITCTLTLDPAFERVLFTVDGTPVDVPTGDGSTTSDGVTRADYAELIVER